MASKFRIQIVNADTGHVVHWAPGQPVEREFIDSICDRLTKSECFVGVGTGSRKLVRVCQVRAAIEELLHELKTNVPAHS